MLNHPDPSPRRRRNRTVLMFILGIVIVGIIDKGSQRLSQPNPSLSPSATTSSKDLAPIAESSSAPQPIRNRTLIGRLSIASAKINKLGITLGTDQQTLDTGLAGAYEWSGPGQTGVFAMAGHRLGAGGPFRHLDAVSVGDMIEISANLMNFHYRVTSVGEVDASDTSVLDGPADRAQIALITCTPMYDFSRRLVVIGELTD